MTIRLCWLYPELMSTYGDRGNIFVLQKRGQWRGIEVEIQNEPETADLIFGGGAKDRQQEIVMRDLLSKKEILRKKFESGVPGLFVCGSPQLLGHYYETAEKTKIKGLGIFDMVTRTGFGKPRLIGNLIGETGDKKTIVGFENHSGRTFLGMGVKPFAKVIRGFGNNGEDGTEGAVFANCLATYMHGPFLSKNPHVADWLIKTALEVKTGKSVELKPLDDALELKAHDFILKKYGH